MVHLFSVRYRDSVDYFNMAIEGDLEAIENELQKYSDDVKYITSRDRNKFDKGKRALAHAGTIVAAEWKYAMRPVWSQPGLHKNMLPADSRHTLLEVNDG